MSASPRASAEVFADLGDANLEIGDERAALDAYARAERLEPNTHLTAFGRGKLSFGRGDLYDAGTHLRRYLDRGGQSCEAFLLLALVQRRTQRHQEARDAAAKGLDACPQDVGLLSPRPGWRWNGATWTKPAPWPSGSCGSTPRTLRAPSSRRSLSSIGNDWLTAEPMARKALELNDQDPKHHQLLERIYQSRGAFEKARFHGEKARELAGKMRK